MYFERRFVLANRPDGSQIVVTESACAVFGQVLPRRDLPSAIPSVNSVSYAPAEGRRKVCERVVPWLRLPIARACMTSGYVEQFVPIYSVRTE
jgi:hypothetical protein